MIGQHVAKAMAEKLVTEQQAQDEREADEARKAQRDAVRQERAEASQNEAAEPLPTRERRPSPTPPEEPSMAQVLAMMAGILSELKDAKTDGASETALKQLALMQGLLDKQEKLLTKEIPENFYPPGISVYDYPEGSLARQRKGLPPKPVLRCKTVWCGRELTGDQETPLEISLLNRLEPGDYRVTKSDMSQIEFKVTATRGNAGQLDEVAVWFPCNKEHRQNHMPMSSYLQQALGERIPTAAELLIQLEALKAELARAQAGVVGVL